MDQVRKAHVLKKLVRSMSRMRILFIDVETKTAYIKDKRRYQEFWLMTANLVEYRPGYSYKIIVKRDFTNQKEFYEWFDSILIKKSVLYVISANVWFDIRTSGLVFHLIDSGFKDKIFFIKYKTMIIKFTNDIHSIVCLNMQQFIPTSVKKMGDLLKFKKLGVDLDNDDDNTVMIYCRRDVDIITEMFRYWVDFIYSRDLGKFAYTVAGQAFTAFRYRFMDRKIFIHANDYITPIERKAYFGGRTEMFQQGKIQTEKIYKLDINSMYAHLMKTYEMPVKWIDTHLQPGNIKFAYNISKYLCFAEVAIKTDEPIYPIKHDKKLIFPTGRFVTYLAHPELEYAYRNGHIYDIRYMITYNKSIIFKQYVDYFYALRSRFKGEGNEVFSYITKLLINSLYGKFGQKIDREIINETVPEKRFESNRIIDEETGQTYREVYFGHTRKVFLESADEGRESFTAIAATITSHARIYLYKLIKQAGINNVYYCDTDSLFVNQIGYNNLSDSIDNQQMGKLSLEDTTTNLVIHGAKDYIFNDKETIKGIRSDAKRMPDGSFEQISFPGFKGDMKHGFDKLYGIVEVNKTLKRRYDKGVVGPGGRVSPISLMNY